MNKFKKRFYSWLEDKLTKILFGTTNNEKIINHSQAGIIARRTFGFWNKARPYMFLFSLSIVIFWFFPRIAKISNEKLLLIMLFMIYAILFLTYRKNQKV